MSLKSQLETLLLKYADNGHTTDSFYNEVRDLVIAPRPIKPTIGDPKGEKGIVRKITDFYQNCFQDEYHAKPTWDGRIIKLVKADIARLGDETLGELIELFFESPPAWVKINGTGMGYNVFHTQIDGLLEKRRRSKTFAGARR